MTVKVKEKPIKVKENIESIDNINKQTDFRIIDISKFKLSEISVKKCAVASQMVYEFCTLAEVNPDEFLSDKSFENKTQQQIMIDVMSKVTKIVSIAVKDFDYQSKQWGTLATRFYSTVSYIIDAPQEKLMSDSMTMIELEEIVFLIINKFQELKVTGFFSRLHTIYKNLMVLLNSIENVTNPGNPINPNI